MKKRILPILMLAVCVLALSACGCAHEEWIEADCVTAKTCAECGETEGAPLGHSWLVATCDTAKTCEVCGETEGEALGHSWVDAKCDAPKTCENCALSEGEALGHSWQDATTEEPKTCAVCAVTEGERIITDERFTTAACAPVFGKWSCTVSLTGEMMDIEDFEGTVDCLLIFEMSNDGTMTMGTSIADETKFKQDMIQYIVDGIVTQSGVSKEDADAAMQSVYGMNLEEYAAAYMETIDMNSMLGLFEVQGVYYIDGDQFWFGTEWDNVSPNGFTVEGDTLMLEGSLMDDGAEYTVFTRVTE